MHVSPLPAFILLIYRPRGMALGCHVLQRMESSTCCSFIVDWQLQGPGASATYRPHPIAVAVNDPPLRIVKVDRYVHVSASIHPMTRAGVRHTRARALGKVGGIDDHFGGVAKLKGVLELAGL